MFCCNLLLYVVSTIPIQGFFNTYLGIYRGADIITINERITEILYSNKNLTQKHLAESIGVAASTVNNWLKLGRSIPAEFIIPISEFLGVECEFLLTGQISTKSSFNDTDSEWLSLIHQLPLKAQYEFKGELKGYLKRFDEESVAADSSLSRTGTDNLGK